MRACGLPVECHSSAEEFLASPTRHEVTCLLLDLHMDGMSGIELLRRLAAAGEAPPTIIITAHASDLLHTQSSVMAKAILRKPVESATLVPTVGQAIGQE